MPLTRLGRGGRGANVEGASLSIKGLAELQRALRRVDGHLGPDLRKGLREIAEVVRRKAEGNISHRTGRHGDEGPLADSLRLGVTQRTVSVYSNLEHSRVQDQGGRVGRNHATLLKRGEVSQYMTRAVQSSAPEVEQKVNELLDRLGRDFEGD
jgi:hypothetical protein